MKKPPLFFLAIFLLVGCVVPQPTGTPELTVVPPEPTATLPPTATPTIPVLPTPVPTPTRSAQQELLGTLRVESLERLPQSEEWANVGVKHFGLHPFPYEWTAEIGEATEAEESATLSFKEEAVGASMIFEMTCQKEPKACELKVEGGSYEGEIFDITFQVEGVQYHVIWWYLGGSEIHNKWTALISPQ